MMSVFRTSREVRVSKKPIESASAPKVLRSEIFFATSAPSAEIAGKPSSQEHAGRAGAPASPEAPSSAEAPSSVTMHQGSRCGVSARGGGAGGGGGGGGGSGGGGGGGTLTFTIGGGTVGASTKMGVGAGRSGRARW